MCDLLCRNRVANYSRWKAVFDADAQAQQKAGLRLTALWHDLEDSNTVFFLFKVSSIEKAQEFLNDPISAQTAAAAGVIDGEYHFLEQGGIKCGIN